MIRGRAITASWAINRCKLHTLINSPQRVSPFLAVLFRRAFVVQVWRPSFPDFILISTRSLPTIRHCRRARRERGTRLHSTVDRTVEWYAGQRANAAAYTFWRGYLSFQTGKWWQGDFSRGGFTHGMSKGSRHGDAGLTIGREGMEPIYDFIADSRRSRSLLRVVCAVHASHAAHATGTMFQKYSTKTNSPHLARYWAMCEWFDETCGELLIYLEREKLAENTIVIYVTDNGWIQSNTTGGFAPKSKTTPFDAGHRTPILVRWPGHMKPARSSALASSIDLVPTVLAALQLPLPEGLRGINLLDSKAVDSREYVFGEDFTIRSQSLDDVNANVLGVGSRTAAGGSSATDVRSRRQYEDHPSRQLS